jgi:hypothetical protein
MAQDDLNPAVQQAIAETITSQTGAELHSVLKRLVKKVQPFPTFPDMPNIQALEVLPSGTKDMDRGCIVLCDDGEFYELTIRTIPGTPSLGGGFEHIEEYEDSKLSAGDYVAYAYVAIQQLTQIIQQQRSDQTS